MLAVGILAVACALLHAPWGQGVAWGAQLPPSSMDAQGQQPPPPFPWAHSRLPGAVSPRHYHLHMQPNLTTMEFSGVVTIHLQVHEDTDHVVLHASDMKITEVLLWEAEPETSTTTTTSTTQPQPPRHALRVLEHRAFQQVALVSGGPPGGLRLLSAGRDYRLQMSFHANLSTTFHGFYRSSYRTTSGDVRFLASTQFEPTSARAAFPCFDEPAFKANFTIQVVREPRHIALSNMPKVETVALPGGLLEDHFDTSVEMSTYLVAFIVSDFLSVSKTTQHGVKISVYSVPEKIDQTAFALDAAVKLLDFYDEYFDIPYPLPKQDLAAIPDFEFGAMENWGLTTYREELLLFDPDKSSASDKLAITMVIAHELAHQWFGNLVTMAWWNDLWLNEGFANFMEFVSVSVVYPELHVEDLFLGKCLEAMEVDSLVSSHPVSTPVESPAQIREIFDDVSYRKGACILHMLRDFLSAEAFKVGIVSYLKKHAYRNTVSAHLWDSMSQICHQSHDHNEGPIKHHEFCSEGRLQPGSLKWYTGDELDIRAIMDTWTLQEGFPLVSVAVTGREVRLQQERYLKSDGPTPTDGRFLWQIPLTYVTSSSPTVHRFLLKTESDVLYLPSEVRWVKFNVDMAGYYMVHYEDQGWRSLSSLLHSNHTALSSGDRAQLVNNVFQLVSVGKVGLDTALELSLYLSRETHIVVVMQGLSELVPLYKMMEKRDMPDLEDHMKSYIVELFRDLIDLQEWTDSGSVPERMLRARLLMFACVRNHPPCVARAQSLFQLWKDSDGSHSIPSDVRMAVFAIGARTPEGWDFLLEMYSRTLQDSLKQRIMYALTITPLQHKLQWLMEQSLQGDVLKSQDLPGVLVSVGWNPRGYRLAWDFLRNNWHAIITKFDLGSSSISHIVTGVTDQYSTTDMLQEVRSFFSSLTVETGSELRCIRQSLESIQENIRWMDTNLPLLQAWLDTHTQHPPPPRPHEDL